MQCLIVKSRIVIILEGDEFVEGFLTECDGINSANTRGQYIDRTNEFMDRAYYVLQKSVKIKEVE